MKSIFDKTVRAEVTRRIDDLNERCQPLWGKMNVAQMVRHCCLCEEYYQGSIKVKRSFLGRIVGKAAARSILKNEASTFSRNAPTSPVFRVTEAVNDLESEKQKWKSLVERYALFSDETFTHWFFGKLTKTQLGQFVYKHCDHHLKQFGV